MTEVELDQFLVDPQPVSSTIVIDANLFPFYGADLHVLPLEGKPCALKEQKMENFKKLIVLADHQEYGLGSAIVEASISKGEYLILSELDKDCMALRKKHDMSDIRVSVGHVVDQDISGSLKRLDVPLLVLEDSCDGFGELAQTLDGLYGVKDIEKLDIDSLPENQNGVSGSSIIYSTLGRHIEFKTLFKHVDGGYESVMHLGYITIDELKEFFEKEDAL